MKRVLVVDDEVDTLEVMKLFLELSGYDPIATLYPEEVIDLAIKEHPDCLLLDVMMPGIDGFSLCKMLRENRDTAHLPILFCTAYSSVDLEDRRIAAGADGLIMKPFGMDKLVNVISKIIATNDQILSLIRQATEACPEPVASKAPTKEAHPDPVAAPKLRRPVNQTAFLSAKSHQLTHTHPHKMI